jgi:hypothetical protein
MKNNHNKSLLPEEEEIIKSFLSWLESEIKKAPMPFAAPDITPLQRQMHAMQMEEHRQKVRQLRRSLFRRHKRKAPKVSRPVKFYPWSANYGRLKRGKKH